MDRDLTMPLRHISILGSTGSIGTQALDVARAFPDRIKISALTAQNNSALLIKQAIEFQPHTVCIGNKDLFKEVQEALEPYPIQVYAGDESLEYAATISEVDMVLTAVVGFAGLKPTIAAIKAGKAIGLANKETLVVAGAMITNLSKEYRAPIIPVDSEHSAIFQCLLGEPQDGLESLWLTASGGPFRGRTAGDLLKVTKADALKHPKWNMGAKISIDSATMMNKGLEIIEAQWLFDVNPDQIKVVVHPESIIHSMVQFKDGSVKAQLSLPDMRLPIQYALLFPDRATNGFQAVDPISWGALHFEKPDMDTFACLRLAYDAIAMGGLAPCVLNAANEMAVSMFLEDRIAFHQIPISIEHCLNKIECKGAVELDRLIEVDREARSLVSQVSF